LYELQGGTVVKKNIDEFEPGK
jgi:hypothetical protein